MYLKIAEISIHVICDTKTEAYLESIFPFLQPFFQDANTENKDKNEFTFKITSVPFSTKNESWEFIINNTDYIQYFNHSRKISCLSILNDECITSALIFDSLKWAITYFALHEKLYPLHSSMLVKDNVAIALLGPSESGKSTLSDLLRRSWRLGNDELNVLKINKGVLTISPTPFRSSRVCETENKFYPLSISYWLKKNPENFTKPIDFLTSKFILLSSAYIISTENYFADQMFNLANEYSRILKIKELHFAKSPKVCEFIDRNLFEADEIKHVKS